MEEETLLNNLKYPEIINKINEWAFIFRYEFYKQVECFLSSGVIIDYICAKMIITNKLAVISTQPAVELNTINSALFFHDRSYAITSFYSNQPLLWVDGFDNSKFYELKYKKMEAFEFTSGISLYSVDSKQAMSISFATKKINKNINDYYLGNIEYLYRIASFVKKISIPMFNKIFSIEPKNNYFNTKIIKSNSRVFLAINNV